MRQIAFIFRDYWSNRNEYGKNAFAEKKSLDTSMQKEKIIQSPDFEIFSEKGEKCFLVDAHGEVVYENLKHPEIIENSFKIVKINEDLSLRFMKALWPVFTILSTFCFIAAAVSALFPISDWDPRVIMYLTLGILLALIALSARFTRSIKKFWISVFLSLGCLVAVFSWVPHVLEAYFALFEAFGERLLFAFGVFFLVSSLGLVIDMGIQIPFNVRLRSERPLEVGLFLGILVYVLTSFGILPCFPHLLIWGFRGVSILLITVALIIVAGLAPDHSSCKLYLYDGSRHSTFFPFKNPKDSPSWLKSRSKLHWVFRWMYFWKYELTFPRPQPDLERLELWFDALSGKLEWIVSDYHYRELWTRWKGDSQDILIDWDPNFHSIVIYPHKVVVDLWHRYISLVDWKLVLSDFPKILSIGNHLKDIRATIRSAYRDARDLEEISNYFEDIGKIGAETCSSLTWSYWRYQYGAYPKTKSVQRWIRYADRKLGGLGEDASLPQVSFNSSIFRLYGLEKNQAKPKF